MRGRFIFEARPDIFPEGYLTEVETELWGLFYEDRAAKQKAAKR